MSLSPDPAFAHRSGGKHAGGDGNDGAGHGRPRSPALAGLSTIAAVPRRIAGQADRMIGSRPVVAGLGSGLFILALALSSPAVAETLWTGGVEKLASATTHTEGPAVAPDGSIYFCDLTVTSQSHMAAGVIYAFDPRTRTTRVVLSPSGMASGIKFARDGDMVIATGADHGLRSIVRIDAITHLAAFVATTYQNRPFNAPNDLTLDASGRVYFTDPRYFGAEPIEQAVSGVYRVDTDGSVRLVTATMTKPNGIAISPDGRTLYVSNNDDGITDRGRQDGMAVPRGPMQIVAFDLAVDGSVSNRRVVVDYAGDNGPDGITVDALGRIWAAVPDPHRPAVHVYRPDGREVDVLTLPEIPFNVAMVADGGMGWLYVTAGQSLYRVAVRPDVIHLPKIGR